MKRVGLSACFMYPDDSRDVFSVKTLSYMENEMAQYIIEGGAIPCLIPHAPLEKLESFLQEMDAFIFQGGSDLSPKSYQQEHLDKVKWPGDYQRDCYELAIFDFAFKRKRPILGICRGAQLMNTYFGGTLFQDLSIQRPSDIVHRSKEIYDKNAHMIEINKGALLHQIYGEELCQQVNSVHHQGIDLLGKGLQVEAVCKEDGLIEAISYEDPSHPFTLGVQWHPEFWRAIPGTRDDPQELVRALLQSF